MYSPRFMLLNLPMKATDRRFAENAEGRQSLLHHYSPPPSWGLHVGLRLRAHGTCRISTVHSLLCNIIQLKVTVIMQLSHVTNH